MHFEIYKDKAGEWRWRLVADNAKTIADSGEGYVDRADCEAMVTRIKRSAISAPVTFL